MRKIIRTGFLICFFVVSFAAACIPISHGATYYIDYTAMGDSSNGISQATPWKRCPGMTGFSGNYLHTPGDIFIFKGGVTWPSSVLPFSINHSGAGTQIDTYTSDPNWFSGQGWSRPVFDGEHVIAGTNAILIVNGHHVKIDRLKLVNACKSGSSCPARTIEIKVSPDHVEISNCVLEPYAGHGIVASHDGTTGKSRFLIHHNDFSHLSNNIELGCISCENAFDDLQIYNNKFHDMRSALVNGDHGDGIHIHNKGGAFRKYTNVRVFNNRFYGDWGSGDGRTSCTAQVFFEDSVGSGAIFNNQFSFENTDTLRANYIFSPGFIAIYGSDKIDIYNNTCLSKITTPPKWAFSCIAIDPGLSGHRGRFNIKNNICSGTRFGILTQPGFTLNIDHNLYHSPPGGNVGAMGSSFKSFLHWRALGHDLNGAIGDPQFADITGKLDLRLQPSSRAIDAGANLGPPFNVDILGTRRPQTGAWNIGAFEHRGSMYLDKASK